MEIKDYYKLMCKNCAKNTNCDTKCIQKRQVKDVISFKCSNYIKIPRNVKIFFYKNQLFEYEVQNEK